MKNIFNICLLFFSAQAISLIDVNKQNNLSSQNQKIEGIPDFYDEYSGHTSPGPGSHLIPPHFQGSGDDRMMHHLIRYYGTPLLGKCNNHEGKPGESPHPVDWKMPTTFEGEYPDCGKPTGKVILKKEQAFAAAKEAIT